MAPKNHDFRETTPKGCNIQFFNIISSSSILHFSLTKNILVSLPPSPLFPLLLEEVATIRRKEEELQKAED